jgi:hypothetical protein
MRSPSGISTPKGLEARQAAQDRPDVDPETSHWRRQAAKVSRVARFEKAALKRGHGDGFGAEIRQQLVKLIQVGR